MGQAEQTEPIKEQGSENIALCVIQQLCSTSVSPSLPLAISLSLLRARSLSLCLSVCLSLSAPTLSGDRCELSRCSHHTKNAKIQEQAPHRWCLNYILQHRSKRKRCSTHNCSKKKPSKWGHCLGSILLTGPTSEAGRQPIKTGRPPLVSQTGHPICAAVNPICTNFGIPPPPPERAYNNTQPTLLFAFYLTNAAPPRSAWMEYGLHKVVGNMYSLHKSV